MHSSKSMLRLAAVALTMLVVTGYAMQAAGRAVSAYVAPMWHSHECELNAGVGETTLLNRIEGDRVKPDTTVALTDESAPDKLFMEQNYPNPFQNTTSIRYGIPKDSYVRITIHSMLGPVVNVVVNEYQRAGTYTLDLVVPDLMPGVYFYRIQTEYGATTRRMTISNSR